jgi:murein DD-endopeptidase MepM/ murein hydrolase activator NlpD
MVPHTVRQGDWVRVRFVAPEGRRVVKASLVYAGETLPCFSMEGALVALFAVSARTPPGRATPVLWVRYEDGEVEKYPQSLLIQSADFPRQSIRMPKSKTHLMAPEILEKEKRILYSAMEAPTPEPLWEGSFLSPVAGRVSSPFGRTRYVNGRFWSSHAGLDIAAAAGTPVKAANSGRVVVARPLWMRGQTVMIDHGLGVFTLYNHLSRIDVKEGDTVRKGQVVGLVGSTGFSTGAHLHWELRVHRTPANPARALREGILLHE